MSVQKGQNLGGVRTIDDLRDRSVIDAITGCWNVRGVNKRSGCQLWLPALLNAAGRRNLQPGGSGFVRLVGISPKATWLDNFTRFRHIRDGINARE